MGYTRGLILWVYPWGIPVGYTRPFLSLTLYTGTTILLPTPRQGSLIGTRLTYVSTSQCKTPTRPPSGSLIRTRLAQVGLDVGLAVPDRPGPHLVVPWANISPSPFSNGWRFPIGAKRLSAALPLSSVR
jgi:hypothetical protein